MGLCEKEIQKRIREAMRSGMTTSANATAALAVRGNGDVTLVEQAMVALRKIRAGVQKNLYGAAPRIDYFRVTYERYRRIVDECANMIPYKDENPMPATLHGIPLVIKGSAADAGLLEQGKIPLDL